MTSITGIPPYMEKFMSEVFGNEKVGVLNREVNNMSRLSRTVMEDLQIEIECRFRHDFGRGATVFTTEKVFRRVKEHFINQVALGNMSVNSSTVTDRSVSLNNFWKMRETTMNGKDIAIKSLKNSFYTDYQSAKYGTKMAASMEVSGSTAVAVARRLLERKEFTNRDTMNVRIKTRSSFSANNIAYSVDLTEVESYDVPFEFMGANTNGTWFRDILPANLRPRKSYEIELDYTVRAKDYRSLQDMVQDVNSGIPGLCRYIADMAKNVVYQTNYLVGETTIRDLFSSVKSFMGDSGESLYISKRNLPQVRNITTKDLRTFSDYAATPKADGVRTLMYFGNNYVAMIKPPTEFNIVLVVEYDSPYEGLLLDGEFVDMANIKNSTVKKLFKQGAYYVFDVISPSRNSSVEFKADDVIERNNYLRKIMPREFDKDAADKRLVFNKTSSKFTDISGWALFINHIMKGAIYFNLKEYEDAPRHPYKAFRSYLSTMDKLDFEDDGLIFTPRNVPYMELDENDVIKTLKWKPVEKMTIDFLYRGGSQAINDEYTGTLFSSRDRELVPFTGTRFFPYDPRTPIVSDKYNLMDGAVYECAYLNGKFHVHRPRNDKEFPNVLDVAINDWYYINHPITEKMMLGHGYEPLREYDTYRLWETLQESLSSGENTKVLDLLNVNPKRDLPQEICKAIDVGNLPSEFSNVGWTKVHLFDTTNVVELLPTQTDKLLDDVIDIAKEYDLLLMDGNMVQLILGDHKKVGGSCFMERSVDVSLVQRIRMVLNNFYNGGGNNKKILVHRMPNKKEQIVGTINYGDPDEKMIVSELEDGAVQLMFADNPNVNVSLIYDPSIQTTNSRATRIICRNPVSFSTMAEAGSSALSGEGLSLYYEWVPTGILSNPESLFVASDGTGWNITTEKLQETIETISIDSGRFSMSSEGEFARTPSVDIVSMQLVEGEAPAQFLIDYDELEPSTGSRELMIIKPILKRFSELPGKLPYNPNSAIRYAMEISEITLRDQDYQYIVDEFDIGFFLIESDKSVISVELAPTRAIAVRSMGECKNGFMFIRRVESGKYRLMIPSPSKTVSLDNPYRMQHGMISADDPLLASFIGKI